MDTKTALLDSAETIARQRGFDGFSYADLATAVGIRKPCKAEKPFACVSRSVPTETVLMTQH